MPQLVIHNYMSTSVAYAFAPYPAPKTNSFASANAEPFAYIPDMETGEPKHISLPSNWKAHAAASKTAYAFLPHPITGEPTYVSNVPAPAPAPAPASVSASVSTVCDFSTPFVCTSQQANALNKSFQFFPQSQTQSNLATLGFSARPVLNTF